MPEQWEAWLDAMLETDTFEDILELFDLTPQEVFEILYQRGLIDDEQLQL